MMTQSIYVSVQLKTSNLVPKEIKRKRTYFTSPLALLYVKDPLYSLRSQEFLFKNQLNQLNQLKCPSFCSDSCLSTITHTISISIFVVCSNKFLA